MNRRLEGLDGRMLSTQQSAGQTATKIVEKIGELGQTSAQMLQRANDLARLEQALRPPKARGGVGELLLANILRDSLPADSYELQYTFRTGERVDAVVRADKLVPIDAKFPLENFERVVNAADDVEVVAEAAEVLRQLGAIGHDVLGVPLDLEAAEAEDDDRQVGVEGAR